MEILKNLDNPKHLEKMYRDNKADFQKAFNQLYPQISSNPIADVWHERLNYDSNISWGTKAELVFVLITGLLAGLVAKLPELTGIDEEFFYSRNLSFIVLPFLTAWFLWKQNAGSKKIISMTAIFVLAAFYINILPNDSLSDTLILACMHLPFFLWAALGFSFTGMNVRDYEKRLDFLRYNGELVVMSAILMLSGGILTAVTLGLFSLIGVNIEDFYFKYIVIVGAAALPIVGTFLVRTNPQLVNKVSPVIAKVFTPLVMVMLVVYLLAIFYTGKDPYNDRDFLFMFNVLLIGVMAIIFFSVAETTRNSEESKMGTLLLFSLSGLSVIVNGIALSAILFRISEWGITPNRLAVLGSNLLILINLLWVAINLLKALLHKDEIDQVKNSIAYFLPVYAIWALIVALLFPVIFSFS